MANNRSLGTRLRELIHGLRCGIFLMTAPDRRKAIALEFSSLFNAFLQTAVLVSIIPMVMLMIDPSNLPKGRALVWLEPLLSGTDQKTVMLQVAGGILGLILFKGIFTWFQIGWIARFSADCEVRLSSFLMRRILTAHYSWLVRQNSLTQAIVDEIDSYPRILIVHGRGDDGSHLRELITHAGNSGGALTGLREPLIMSLSGSPAVSVP